MRFLPTFGSTQLALSGLRFRMLCGLNFRILLQTKNAYNLQSLLFIFLFLFNKNAEENGKIYFLYSRNTYLAIPWSVTTCISIVAYWKRKCYIPWSMENNYYILTVKSVEIWTELNEHNSANHIHIIQHSRHIIFSLINEVKRNIHEILFVILLTRL